MGWKSLKESDHQVGKCPSGSAVGSPVTGQRPLMWPLHQQSLIMLFHTSY